MYLDGGPCAENIPSTILDLTGTIPKVLRAGAISVDRLRTVASVIADDEHYAGRASPAADRRARRRQARVARIPSRLRRLRWRFCGARYR